jgi:hypothetical protein
VLRDTSQPGFDRAALAVALALEYRAPFVPPSLGGRMPRLYLFALPLLLSLICTLSPAAHAKRAGRRGRKARQQGASVGPHASIAEKLLAIGVTEEKDDPYLYWLFTTAAAQLEPGNQGIATHAVQAASRIVPALANDLIDDATAAHGGRMPPWLKSLQQQNRKHQSSLSVHTLGVSSDAAELAELPPPQFTSTFATVPCLCLCSCVPAVLHTGPG